mgnify:CR=1 FL=1
MGKIVIAASLLSALVLSPALATEQTAEPEIVDAATYKPKTEHDNTPYRFNMEQNGKRMSADEFDAWMKARGVRVATGKPAVEAASAPAADTDLADK